MAIKKGRVVEKKLFIEVDRKKHYMPKGCDPIIGPQLEVAAGMDVEVLMAKDVILAIRPVEPERWPWKPPIIICYLCPPDIVFDHEIMREIEPVITQSLVKSGYLDANTVKQLDEWKQQIPG